FRHSAIYIRADRGITRPEDLRGRRVGIPEYQLTANVWARAVLRDYGVDASEITWVQGGQEHPGRAEKIALSLPPTIHIEPSPVGQTLSAMLARGQLDGLVAPRAPSCFLQGHPDVARLFPDSGAARAWYER